ncbi:AraC family transcriptional regulator [Myceligenerans indicum]|uniref:AraC family transcriptional regulator n=1 Tax=Myceligenerans indicum TaxID=2593663 RepID=A0ABS1LRQ5_9MICO|nr:AraC family transcriptional regulator [Myceligenerans indicum]MBL0888699.1 AraC family transcriptional regulator [Myceligenerans indicum]
MSEFWHSAVMPQVESRRSCQEVACYRPHTHERFSIGLIDAGTTTFTGAAGEPIPLAAGDVVLIPAGHVHACNPERGRWEYQMIQADQEWVAGLLPDGPDAGTPGPGVPGPGVPGPGVPGPGVPGGFLTGITVFRNLGLHHRLSTVNDLLFTATDSERVAAAFRRVLRECAMLRPHRRVAPTTDADLAARMGPVLDRLRHDESNPPLAELGELVGMGRYQLIRAMKRATGLPPVAWRQNHRVIAARTMLRDGRSPAETAHALGFSDQSHFHRVFRAHVAASPGAYRR